MACLFSLTFRLKLNCEKNNGTKFRESLQPWLKRMHYMTQIFQMCIHRTWIYCFAQLSSLFIPQESRYIGIPLYLMRARVHPAVLDVED